MKKFLLITGKAETITHDDLNDISVSLKGVFDIFDSSKEPIFESDQYIIWEVDEATWEKIPDCHTIRAEDENSIADYLD